ncbi:MAG: DUF3352 domain-containing protein [Bacteroidota bacterium]
MKKAIIAVVILGVIGVSLAYYFLWVPVEKIQAFYLVPKDAVFILESEEPVDGWETISSSNAWRHLKKNKTFAELTVEAESLDSLLNDNRFLADYFGNRSIVISAHQYGARDYDFLFIVDLAKASKISGVESYIENLAGKDYRVTRRNFEGKEIIELYDKKGRDTIYLTIIENQLVVSYTHFLVENSIKEFNSPTLGRDIDFVDVSEKIGYDDMFRAYLQYEYFDEYVKLFTGQDDEFLTDLSNSLKFSGFTYTMSDEGLLQLRGYTNFNEEISSTLRAIYESGKGPHDIFDIASVRTSFLLELGFDDFDTFVKNLEATLEESPEDYEEYKKNKRRIERFLRISLQKHFIDWADNEIAMMQMYAGEGRVNEYALVMKAKDPEEAKKNLNFIARQIKRKTPIKFRNTTYKGYPINYLSIKGFFKLFLGKLFERFDKPFYTIVDDYVVFSNHPQTLKNIINDYEEGNTLSKSEDFKDFGDDLSSESSAFVYVNNSILFESLRPLVTTSNWRDISENKDFITCFTKIGIQMKPDGDLFRSDMFIQFIDPNEKIEEAEMIAEALPNEALKPLSFFETIAINKDSSQIDNSDPIEFGVEEEVDYLALLDELDEIVIDDLTAKTYRQSYDSGQLKYEIELKGGLKDGSFRAYYENGKTQYRGKYKNDLKHGVWRIYDEEGDLLKRLKFDYGIVED